MDALHDAEATFISTLARLLDRTPEALLTTLLEPAGPIPTQICDGRFVQLSLRALGPRLRWATPGDALSLNLDGLDALRVLDLTGLELTALDLRPLRGLTHLEAADNALHHLDVETLTGLEVLNVASNRLMVLDLRAQSRLTHLDARGNELAGLLLPSPSALRELRLGRNHLMALELDRCPHLHTLDLSRNALVGIRLETPALQHLDLRHNQLRTLDLQSTTALRSLRVDTNRLGALEPGPQPGLHTLTASHNYLDRVDLRPYDQLRVVALAHNQLTALHLPASIEELDCSHNRLTSFTARCPRLARLRCAHNPLHDLDGSTLPALCTLEARSTALRALDLRPLPRLARLDLGDTPLEKLTVGSSPRLAHLEIPSSTSMEIPPDRLRPIAALVEPLAAPPEAMDRFQLHRFAATYDEPDRERVLMDLVSDTDRCALGTAVMVYWTTSPHYYLRFGSREDVPSYARGGWDLLRTIEDRVRHDAYRHDDVFFDPRDDQQTVDPRGRDWTRHGFDPDGPRPPAFMGRRCGGGR